MAQVPGVLPTAGGPFPAVGLPVVRLSPSLCFRQLIGFSPEGASRECAHVQRYQRPFSRLEKRLVGKTKSRTLEDQGAINTKALNLRG